MQSALMRTRAAQAARILALVLTVMPAPQAAVAEEESLTLDEARRVAQQAALAGDHALARALAIRLAEVDPLDARALLILSASATAMGDAEVGLAAGQAAWRAARRRPEGLPPDLRYDIARHAAHAAWSAGRLTTAQIWLRRATDKAPDAHEYDRSVQDFRQVRGQNPLKLAFSLSVTPSSNLNGGASSGWLTIDDWYFVGPQSGTSLALSGFRTIGQAQMIYALPPDATGRTYLGLRAFGAFHDLSSEAKRITGGLSGTYLNFTSVEGSLSRQMNWPGTKWPLSLKASLGHAWEAGESAGPLLRLEGTTPVWMRDSGYLNVTVLSEWQDRPDGMMQSTGISLEGEAKAGPGRIGWSLALRDGNGPDVNRQYRSVSGEVSYEPDRSFGNIRLRGALSAGMRDFPEYTLGPFGVTDGREDRNLGLSLDIMPDGLTVMGYVPRVTLNAQATDSNISRFETRQMGVSLGIDSRF